MMLLNNFIFKCAGISYFLSPSRCLSVVSWPHFITFIEIYWQFHLRLLFFIITILFCMIALFIWYLYLGLATCRNKATQPATNRKICQSCGWREKKLFNLNDVMDKLTYDHCFWVCLSLSLSFFYHFVCVPVGSGFFSVIF